MDHYAGEIRLFAGGNIPEGWHACDGSLLDVSEYQVLFSLIGTIYGGDGVKDFALPNLIGRIPIGQGTGPGRTPRVVGWENGHAQEVTLTNADLPTHTHDFRVSTRPATKATLEANLDKTVIAAPNTPNDLLYWKTKSQVAASVVTNSLQSAAGAISPAGGGKSHSNLMPTFALIYMIALSGEYPVQS